MKKYTNILYWFAMSALLFWFAYSKGWIFANFESINAQQAILLMEKDENITILDVRSIPEYKEGHLQDATLIPLDILSKNIDMLKKKKRIIVYCRSGNRSVAASRILEKNGFIPMNVKGGILQLKKSGATIVK